MSITMWEMIDPEPSLRLIPRWNHGPRFRLIPRWIRLWLDRLDVYLVQDDRTLSHVHTGDTTVEAEGLLPAIGYALPLRFPPGPSEVYLRVESIGPMVLPIELMSDAQLSARKHGFDYVYGFVYGFLAALSIYNFLLFVGLGERSYLYYALALLSFIACNIGYTGHGLALWWPGRLSIQAYAIPVMMVLYAVLGWLFASRFLDLAEHAPRACMAVRWASGAGLLVLVVAVLAGNQLLAARLAFLFMSLFVLVTFLLGVQALRQGRASGRYFLAATFSGLLGAVTTDLAVWGKLPFTPLTFHAAEQGFIIEATLLALALAHRIRGYQHASRHAERLARLDSLTGLLNRRAFLETAQTWSGGNRRGRQTLSLVMMDIDHFKQINDEHGHQVGDEVLRAVAVLLSQQGRISDIVARWGGEEFLLLLPDTDLSHASSYAERLRQATAAIRVPVKGGQLSITVSIGVAEHGADATLVDTINAADMRLYQAKGQGRNRVCDQLGLA
jgi:diguanylate cyclase (GGDEF)-like protein